MADIASLPYPTYFIADENDNSYAGWFLLGESDSQTAPPPAVLAP